MSLDRVDEAIECATAAIAAAGDVTPEVAAAGGGVKRAGLLSDRAYSLFRAKRVAEALEDLEAVADASAGAIPPESRKLYAICHSTRGGECDREGDLDAAEKHYTLAIAAEPTEASLFNRAYLYQRQGEGGAARGRARAGAPTVAPPPHRVAGKTEEAIAGFKAVQALNPGNAQANSAAGQMLLQQDRFAEALPLLTATLALRPGQAPL